MKKSQINQIIKNLSNQQLELLVSPQGADLLANYLINNTSNDERPVTQMITNADTLRNIISNGVNLSSTNSMVKDLKNGIYSEMLNRGMIDYNAWSNLTKEH